MSSMFLKTIQLFTGEPVAVNPKLKEAFLKPKKKYSDRDLLRMESAVGRHLFGPIPDGVTREFFCLDDRTWIWYEQWKDAETLELRERTIRYEVHSKGVIKIQEDQPYVVLEGDELKNFGIATRLYYEHVMRDVYRRDPMTGHALDAA